MSPCTQLYVSIDASTKVKQDFIYMYTFVHSRSGYTINIDGHSGNAVHVNIHSHYHGNKVKLSENSFSLFTCKLVIQKKLVNNQNLNIKVVFSVLIADQCQFF